MPLGASCPSVVKEVLDPTLLDSARGLPCDAAVQGMRCFLQLSGTGDFLPRRQDSCYLLLSLFLSQRDTMTGKKKAKTTTAKKVATRKQGEVTSYSLNEDVKPYIVRPQRFIDLFCGIGGFRIAFEKAGGTCVFSSDYDKFSQQTYEANFGEKPHGDINEIAVADIPAHDILCGGFPCQPFSIAGVSKKNSLGRLHGFDDVKQGNLFFSIADILDHHRPTAFVLENVKNLKGHDKGRTFAVIKDTLESVLGYTIYTKIIDAKTVVPQHRERIFIVGFREKRDFEFSVFPSAGPLFGMAA